MSFWTEGSSNLLPINLFVAKIVFSEFVMACLLAAAPTILSPSLVKATTEGVVLAPYEFSMTLGVLPSISATQELVVPRSIPIIVSPFLVEKVLKRVFLKIVLIMLSVKSWYYKIYIYIYLKLIFIKR